MEMSNSMEYVSRFRALAEILERIGAQLEMKDGKPLIRSFNNGKELIYYFSSNGDFGMGPREEEKLLGVFPLKVGGLEFSNPIYHPYEVEYDGDNASSATLSFTIRWT